MRRLAPALLITLTACGSGEPDAGSLDPKLDAPVVHSESPRWTEGAGWSLSDAPVVEIGLQDGPDEYVFGGLADVVRLEDGRIVAIDRSSSEIRFYSPAGEFLFQTGRKGKGPGEYGWAYGLTIGAEDSLYVLDNGSPRATVLLTDGSLQRTYMLHPGEETPGRSVHAILEDGRLVAYGRGIRRVAESTGFLRDTLGYFLWSAAGEYRGSLGRHRGGDRFSRPELGQFLAYMPFQPGFWKSGGVGSLVMLGNGIEPEIQLWGPDATLHTVVRWDASPRPVTPDLKRAYEAYRLERAEPGSPEAIAMNKWLAETPYPDRLPAYEEFLSDDEGNLWVQEYQVPWETARSWTVLSADYDWLGSVAGPPGFTITHVAHRFVTGIHHDDLGVARVRVYALATDDWAN